MGFRDFVVEQAAAQAGRAAARADRQDAWTADRARELLVGFAHPMGTTVSADYAMPAGPVPLLVEFLAWVMAVQESPDWRLAEALHQPVVMQRLRESWAVQRAEMEAARMPDSAWEAA